MQLRRIDSPETIDVAFFERAKIDTMSFGLLFWIDEWFKEVHLSKSISDGELEVEKKKQFVWPAGFVRNKLSFTNLISTITATFNKYYLVSIFLKALWCNKAKFYPCFDFVQVFAMGLEYPMHNVMADCTLQGKIGTKDLIRAQQTWKLQSLSGFNSYFILWEIGNIW